MNITIPYKKSIIKQLDLIDAGDRKIEAVNTLICKNNKLKVKVYNRSIEK